MVYQATISSKEEPEVVEHYIGVTKKQFKTRFASNNYSFNNEKQKGSTELSKWYWHLESKIAGINSEVEIFSTRPKLQEPEKCMHAL